MIRDYLMKGPGGAYQETYQELFNSSNSDQEKQGKNSHSDTFKVMNKYCNLKKSSASSQ